MTCRVYNCLHNEDGYCHASSYIELDEDGCCDTIVVPTILKEDNA